MKVSVIICTYNRADYLKLCLNALFNNNDYNLENYEVILVDNKSTDNTKEIATSYKNVKYVYEENAGLSYARNKGIIESQNEIVAFLDDDAIPHKNYISGLIDAFEKKNVTCGGGKINPIWTVDKPDWYTEEFNGVFTIADYGDVDIIMTDNYPYGANMFFLRKALTEVGVFNVELGLKGNEIIMGEDDEMFFRFKEKGHQIWYIHNVSVDHHIPEYKIDKKYVLKRFRAGGEALAKSYKRLKSSSNFKYQYNRWKFKYLVKVIPLLKLAKLSDKNVFEKECIVALNEGFINTCKKLM